MKNKRLLGLVGFLLAIIGGILLIRSGLDFRLTLQAILRAFIPLTLGLLAVVGAFLEYTKKYRDGGILCIAAGLLALVLDISLLHGALVLLGGVLGLVAAAR